MDWLVCRLIVLKQFVLFIVDDLCSTLQTKIGALCTVVEATLFSFSVFDSFKGEILFLLFHHSLYF